MYFVYVLRSKKDKKFYTGCTSNLDKRIIRHSKGLVKSTKLRGLLEVVYYEACLDKKDAMKRELYLKSAWGKRYVKNRIKMYLSK